MPYRQGFSLMEMIVVLIIIGIAAAVALPNFTNPTEHALALTAQNNLLAIYSAQKNYFINNGNYCVTAVNPNLCDSLSDINANLSLNIQDDGSYTYACPPAGGTPLTCVATRSNPPGGLTITLTLTSPVQLNGGINPHCAGANDSWCP